MLTEPGETQRPLLSLSFCSDKSFRRQLIRIESGSTLIVVIKLLLVLQDLFELASRDFDFGQRLSSGGCVSEALESGQADSAQENCSALLIQSLPLIRYILEWARALTISYISSVEL